MQTGSPLAGAKVVGKHSRTSETTLTPVKRHLAGLEARQDRPCIPF